MRDFLEALDWEGQRVKMGRLHDEDVCSFREGDKFERLDTEPLLSNFYLQVPIAEHVAYPIYLEQMLMYA
jgi:hypothetical protein